MATPLGQFRPVTVLYRADRVRRPVTMLPTRAIRPSDGWCDAVGDPNYNRLVRHPYPRSAERLWRDDALYDLVVVTSHNQRPRVQGLGSAVFIHVAPPMAGPTAGCIGLQPRDLRRLVKVMTPRTTIAFAAM